MTSPYGTVTPLPQHPDLSRMNFGLTDYIYPTGKGIEARLGTIFARPEDERFILLLDRYDERGNPIVRSSPDYDLLVETLLLEYNLYD